MVKVKADEFKKQLEEATNNWKRALADYANLEKRIVQEKEDFIRFANKDLILRLLAVLDDLERAEKHLKDQGLSLAINHLRMVLKDEGVEETKVLGQKFDPSRMDCAEVVKGPDKQIMEIVQKGYLLKEKLLRPAKVKVGDAKFSSNAKLQG